MREDLDDQIQIRVNSRWLSPNWLSWNKYSEVMLRTLEKKILQILKTPYRGFFVDIGPVVGPTDKIWTVSFNTESPKTPLVLIHGLGAGVALWCLNIDALAATRPVYAFDLLGFGRSSRPEFDSDAMAAEKQMVRSIEEWRKEMKLKDFILCGHSMGGFLATAYSLSYPDKVKHLILADPWGFPEKPSDTSQQVPLWIKTLSYVMQPFNPLASVRMAGPLGIPLDDKLRFDKYITNLNSKLASACFVVWMAANELSQTAARAVQFSLVDSQLRHTKLGLPPAPWFVCTEEFLQRLQISGFHTQFTGGYAISRRSIISFYSVFLVRKPPLEGPDNWRPRFEALLQRTIQLVNQGSLQLVSGRNNIVWGPWFINTLRPDISKKYLAALNDPDLIPQYIYQCNSQSPSGESAFHCMMSGFGWAKNPMVRRIDHLDSRVPITLLWGSKSWIDHSAEDILKGKRYKSYFKLQVIGGAGHHVYADKPEQFNQIVLEACEYTDSLPRRNNLAIMPPDGSDESEVPESDKSLR